MAIVTNNDLEVILNGSQEQVIRKMLKDRLFCLIKLPTEKPDRCISRFSSSVFVGTMNYWCARTLAIRKIGSMTVYGDCEYYLCMYHERGINEENKGYFDRSFRSEIKKVGSFSYPSIDELIDFLGDKELFLISNWMQYGNMESMKVKDFLETVLFLWKDSELEFIPRQEGCDIRVYLKRIGGENNDPEDGLSLEDIRDFEIISRIIHILKKKSSRFRHNYYAAEYETQQGEVQASYFVTRFHSNTAWDADPVNIVNSRVSAFVLPGTVPESVAEKLTQRKKTQKRSNRTKYVIDSIHCNSDVFYDIAEFAKYMGSYFGYFAFD